ncbi:hypothetical protein PputGB1_2969 [Pseudomonas putida GB-1]|uniref:Uncharacterized protein n=1 Tax=Pseudomonas putida (strain GB-1) TaxID=76869 RepID=B0KFD8_PSEPG|nr:hypothetical protein PputGB1_2969 [Pseudomonas putida GB-1]
MRVPLAGFALLLWLTATIFFMGQAEDVFSHWQVASAWLAWLGTAGMFAAAVGSNAQVIVFIS